VCSVECVDGFGAGGMWGVVSIVVGGLDVGSAVICVSAIVAIVEMLGGCILVVLGVFAIVV
jgi:hypothetical protein